MNKGRKRNCRGFTSRGISIKKIKQIFDELEEHPQIGIGQPEQLKYSLSGYWSRRINQKDRIIYRIDEAIVTVFIVSASSHYGAK